MPAEICRDRDGLLLDDVVFIDDDTDEEMSGSRVNPRDALLNITGASLGRCVVVPPIFQPSPHAQEML